MRNRTGKSKRRGVALLMVLILIVVISLGAYSYTQLMTTQESASVISSRRAQADAAVASGVEYIKDYLSMSVADRMEVVGGHYDNPTYFKDIAVGGPDQGNTRFSIVSVIADQYGEPTDLRFGLTDQNSKLNVNFLASEAYEEGSDLGGAEDLLLQAAEGEDSEFTEMVAESSLAREALMFLPGMTELIADAILDWIDADTVPREFGAEGSSYAAFGYEPRNADITSLDELLLVQGVTNELLYGADRNHNGIIDQSEQEDAMALTSTGSMARGWSAYLTVKSADIFEQAEETIDVNQEDLEALFTELTEADFDEDFANYVIVYRQGGAYQEEIPDPIPDDYEPVVPEPITGRSPDYSQSGDTDIEDILDLLGGASQGSFPVEGQDEPDSVVCAAPYGDSTDLSQLLPMMQGLLSTKAEKGDSQGINTNLASEAVIAGLPGLDEAAVQNILQSQDRAMTSNDANYLYSTWPLAKGAVTVEQMKQIQSFCSGTGAIFRAQIVAYSDVPGVFSRAEVVIDSSGDEPIVLSFRDLSNLGPGFAVETLTQ